MKVVLVNFEGAFLIPDPPRDASHWAPFGENNLALHRFTGYRSEVHAEYWDRLKHRSEIPETNDLNESVWKIVSSLSMASYNIQFITNAPCGLRNNNLTRIRSRITRFTGWPRQSFIIHYRMSNSETDYYYQDKEFALSTISGCAQRGHSVRLLIDHNIDTCRYVHESLSTPCLHIQHPYTEGL